MPGPNCFAKDQSGFTGAERALVLCFALAIIVLTGALLHSGSGRAARDAERVLKSGTGTPGEIQLTEPLTEPQMIRAAAAMGPPGTDSPRPPPPPPSEPPRAIPLPQPRPVQRTFTDAVYQRHVARVAAAQDIRLDPGMQADLDRFARNWEQNRARYERVAEQTGVPARLIAAIHWRESTGNFNTYLHQGDPLGRPARNVPRNIPVFHRWEDAAVHALGMKRRIQNDLGIHAGTTDMAAIATYAEYYNGLGYHNRNRPSPYVYSGTDQYDRGKFVRDGVYDPNHRDRQLGIIRMFRSLPVAAPRPE